MNLLTTNNHQRASNSNTFAVVVGISNYHDKGIPDLKYAHRDAIAFVDWLKGTGMVKVPEDHIQLLIDSMATRAQFNAALDGILDQAREGDLVYLYFSGHGDVETKTIAKFGYLLCYDSPPNNYAAGAFSLDYLQAIVSTLASNKTKVVVIADACHAGKLAGSNVLGSRLTSTELVRQYANEIKILSCQPNETSVEGEYWGGGRGVFSYYLTDGLSGFADQNEDRQIKLMELANYLQTNVSRDVDPHKQIPVIAGDLSETINLVDEKQFLAMMNEKKFPKILDMWIQGELRNKHWHSSTL
ncbi:MAG: caspase family protein [Saprospiraceae bacterium]|nr:caspase family protein [Saprospiraceae bacterium]